MDKETRKASDKLDMIKDSLFVMFGAMDEVVDVKTSEKILEKVQVEDKTVKVYPGHDHLSGFLDGHYQLM